jgi:hypothetical protein
MTLSLRRLAIFTVRFLALLAAFVPLWALLAPFYAGLLAGLGNSTLTLIGLPPTALPQRSRYSLNRPGTAHPSHHGDRVVSTACRCWWRSSGPCPPSRAGCD